MDSLSAFARGDAARCAGNKSKVFDWNKAARLIKERNAQSASAGLSSDWEYTGGEILTEGKPNKEAYTYLASVWATPEIDIDGDVEECWAWAEQTDGWKADTKWPESALELLK